MPSAPYLDGWLTHKAGLTHPSGSSMPENPYDRDRQQHSYIQWVNGWVDRNTAVTRKGNLDLDSHAD